MLAMRMSGSRGGRRPGPLTPRCDCSLAEADQFPALALPCIDGYREIGLPPLPIAIAAKQLTVRPVDMRFPGIGGAIIHPRPAGHVRHANMAGDRLGLRANLPRPQGRYGCDHTPDCANDRPLASRNSTTLSYSR